MSITYGELKKRILKKIDEYEADVDGWTDDEDIINKMPDAVNEAIRFVFYAKSHDKTWNVRQGSTFNALEKDKNDPDYQPLFGEHRNNDIIYEANDVYTYYFEVDDTADIYIEAFQDNEWITLETIQHKSDLPFSEFVSYKGRFADNTLASRVRIRFSGDYYYKFRNVCAHNVNYETIEKIPAFTGYMQHDIPKNLYQIVQAYQVVDGQRKNVSYYTEDYKLYLPAIEGTIYLVSKFFPDPVDEETDDSYLIDIPIDTEWIVVSKAAAILTTEGEPSDFLADEEQYMQMLEGDRGHSGAPKVVRLR